MSTFNGFICVRCQKHHSPEGAQYLCPACGGNLQVTYDYDALKKRITRESLARNPEHGIWRYLDLLPIRSREFCSPLQIGWTPLYAAKNLGRELGLSHLFVKDDGRNPSASFKDRAGAIAIAHAMEKGERLITGASTGNAASSLACLSAGMGIRTIIFVPETAPIAKVAQLLVFGAKVISVKGNYDQAFDLCLKASAEYGWYNRNTGYNPFTREGKKTCSFEILEQLGWQVPDKVLVSVGDGNIISGIWKGFTDFYKLGLIDKLPQLVAVQGEGSNAVKLAFENGGPVPTVSGDTIADSISVSLPRDGEAAVQALKESKGFAVSVTDGEILDAMTLLGRREGVFAEPAGSATVAGLKKAVKEGRIGAQERVVAIITGNGLKDVGSALKASEKAAGKPYPVEPLSKDPDMNALKSLVKSGQLGS